MWKSACVGVYQLLNWKMQGETLKFDKWVVFDYTMSIFKILYNTTDMSHLEVTNASRGGICKYENLKMKLYNSNANIYFNRQCLQKQLIPNYARIKVPNTSPAFKHTQHKVPNIRIKGENKYLYTKKQRINQQIFHTHLTLANAWKLICVWLYIVYFYNSIQHNGDVSPESRNANFELYSVCAELLDKTL